MNMGLQVFQGSIVLSFFFFPFQGSFMRGVDPNYANKLSIPVPKMVEDGKRTRVKNPKLKLRTKVCPGVPNASGCESRWFSVVIGGCLSESAWNEWGRPEDPREDCWFPKGDPSPSLSLDFLMG